MQVEKYRGTLVARSISLLTRRDKFKLLNITLVQSFLGFLDLIGVLSIGALGALAIQGIESHAPGNKVGQLLRILGISNLTFQNQVAILGITAAMLLISKTLIAIFFSRKTLYFLSKKNTDISKELISKVLSQDLINIQKWSSQDILYMVSDGVKNIFLGVLATLINMISDIFMLIILIVGLFAVDPAITLSASFLFIAVGYFLHLQLQVRAKEVGIESNALIVQSNQKTIEVLFSYRESVVRNRRQFYANEISKLRYSLGKVNAETSFQPFISKYVLEVTSILGSIALASYEFGTKNAVHAVAVLALFMAATSRIAPAALRIQQGILLVKNSSGGSSSTFQLISELKNVKVIEETVLNPDFTYDGFEAEIVATNLEFQYQNESKFALEGINFRISAGSSAAIVGPSGAGKTTLIDLLLGVLEPQKGFITVSNSTPSEAIKRWPGAISYVPQNVFISNATIRENVGLGYPTQFISDFRVKEALAAAQLFDIVENFKGGIDAPAGENGAKISGGQRQRLGIARALFTSPKLLVLDEATSALDGKTEADLTKSIELMSGKVTVIVVAHRLSTVQKVDQVIYMDKGRVLATGKFDDVRKLIPNFDLQARLMGL